MHVSLLFVASVTGTAFVCSQSYEEEDTCMSYEEEDTCMSHEEEDTCMSYEEEDTCMSYEEENTCLAFEGRRRGHILSSSSIDCLHAGGYQ